MTRNEMQFDLCSLVLTFGLFLFPCVYTKRQPTIEAWYIKCEPYMQMDGVGVHGGCVLGTGSAGFGMLAQQGGAVGSTDGGVL